LPIQEKVCEKCEELADCVECKVHGTGKLAQSSKCNDECPDATYKFTKAVEMGENGKFTNFCSHATRRNMKYVHL